MTILFGISDVKIRKQVITFLNYNVSWLISFCEILETLNLTVNNEKETSSRNRISSSYMGLQFADNMSGVNQDQDARSQAKRGRHNTNARYAQEATATLLIK
jgi:hypothetical protein